MSLLSRRVLPTGLAIILTGCATSPSLIDSKSDPASPTAPEGSTMVQPTSELSNAPATNEMHEQKEPGQGMGNMKMNGMDMPATKVPPEAGGDAR